LTTLSGFFIGKVSLSWLPRAVDPLLDSKFEAIWYWLPGSDFNRCQIRCAICHQELRQKSSAKHREIWKLTSPQLTISQIQAHLRHKCDASLTIKYDLQ
jgi:hypothetical protein